METRSPTNPCQCCRRWSHTSQPLPCKCRSGFLYFAQLECVSKSMSSVPAQQCFPTIINHKGPEAWDCVCFGLVPITRDHKDTLQEYINSFYSVSVPRFIRECSLKKGYFRKANVALSWPVDVGWLRWMWAQLLSSSHWHGNISRLLGHKHWAFLNKSMN